MVILLKYLAFCFIYIYKDTYKKKKRSKIWKSWLLNLDDLTRTDPKATRQVHAIFINAVNISWVYIDLFLDFTPRLGRLHTLMSFVEAVDILMCRLSASIRDKFLKGVALWNGLWSDLCIHWKFIYGHSSGGLVSITLQPSILNHYALNLHFYAQLR